jgi:hypothetical protein
LVVIIGLENNFGIKEMACFSALSTSSKLFYIILYLCGHEPSKYPPVIP